jgi:Transmembrane protein 43
MSDRVTVTSRKGWLARLSESIKSVLVGGVLFVLAFPLLFWNEGRAVTTARSLDEGAGVVVSADAERVEPSNEGRLVHVSAFAKTDDVLRDDAFGVAENAIALVREVEMYQWVEHKSSKSAKKLGGSEETTTTYEYSKEWSSSLVDSDGFQSPDGHRNPQAFPYEQKTETAGNVALGAFTLSEAQVGMLRKQEPLAVSQLPGGIPGAKLHDGTVYVGSDPAKPAIGDVVVRFRVVRGGPVSVVARQVRSTFEPYHAAAGGSVFLLEEAVASASAMFESAQAANTMITWVLRAVGFFMMFLGLSLVFRPIAVFGDVVPLVGRLLGAGVGLFAALVAAVLSFVTIAVAWFVYRPLLSFVLVALAAGALALLVRATRSRGAPAVPPPPPIPVGAPE